MCPITEVGNGRTRPLGPRSLRSGLPMLCTLVVNLRIYFTPVPISHIKHLSSCLNLNPSWWAVHYQYLHNHMRKLRLAETKRLEKDCVWQWPSGHVTSHCSVLSLSSSSLTSDFVAPHVQCRLNSSSHREAACNSVLISTKFLINRNLFGAT